METQIKPVRVFQMDNLVTEVNALVEAHIRSYGDPQVRVNRLENCVNSIMHHIEQHLISALVACPECFAFGLEACHIECTIQGHWGRSAGHPQARI